MTAGRAGRAGLVHAGAVLAVYTAVALWATRPLWRHLADGAPAPYALTDYDVHFNLWVFSWVAHALVTDPLHLFAANIYHPAPDALAYAEHWLGSAPFFAPAYLATGNPAVGLNAMIVTGLVLSAAATYLVVWRWTGSRAAAFFAGLVFGFYPAHLRPLGPNLVTLQYLPLVLLFLDRVLAGAGRGATVGLAAALLGQSLTSLYYAYPVVLATAGAAVAVAVPRTTRPAPAALARVAGALGATGLVLALAARPYFRVAAGDLQTMYDFVRQRALVLPTPAWDVLAASVRLLGVPAVVLAGVAVARSAGRGADAVRRRRVLVLVVWVAVGHVLFAGRTVRVAGRPVPMPARVLERVAPGYAVLRDRDRLFVPAPAALAVLAGLGIAAVAGAAAPGAGRAVLAAAVAAGATLATAAGMDLGPQRLKALATGAGVPPVYRALAARKGPVLELPIGATDADLAAARANAEYEYLSVFHWRPLLNGYSSFWPAQFEVVTAMARALPAPHARENLAACTGLAWVVVHAARLAPAARARWGTALPGLALAGRFGDDLLYGVAPPGRDCTGGLFAPVAGRTLEGTPRTPLAAGARRAAIEALDVPTAIPFSLRHAGPEMSVALEARVRLRNAGDAVWPAVGPGSDGLVRLAYRWTDPAGRKVGWPGPVRTRLPADLAPGEAIDLPLAFRLPRAPGEYRFQVVVEQAPRGRFRLSGPGALPVPVTVTAPGAGPARPAAPRTP